MGYCRSTEFSVSFSQNDPIVTAILLTRGNAGEKRRSIATRVRYHQWKTQKTIGRRCVFSESGELIRRFARCPLCTKERHQWTVDVGDWRWGDKYLTAARVRSLWEMADLFENFAKIGMVPPWKARLNGMQRLGLLVQEKEPCGYKSYSAHLPFCTDCLRSFWKWSDRAWDHKGTDMATPFLAWFLSNPDRVSGLRKRLMQCAK